MYRYVLKRVRDSIEFGVNIRKSFACQQNVNLKQNEKSECNKSVVKAQEVQFLPAECRNYEQFKKRYNCRHPNSRNNLLSALTWVCLIVKFDNGLEIYFRPIPYSRLP